jgi:hypothetical protein
MAFEVKRKAELTLATLLMEALPDFTFYVSKGGTDTGGVTLPKPPFGAVWIDDAEKTISYEKIYFLRGSVVWITRAGKGEPGTASTDVAVHSDAVQQIYNAMLEIGSGADVDRKLIVHGIDVGSVNEFSDIDRLAHGDVIAFTMGVTEFD